MSTPPTRRSNLETHCAHRIIDSVTDFTILKDFPVVKYCLYKIYRIKLGQRDPDLLESLTSLGQNIAIVGFSFALCALSFLPATCCIITAAIFKYTGKALCEKRRFAHQIEQLTLTNKGLAETQQKLTTLAESLQHTLTLETAKVNTLASLIKTANITTEKIQKLQAKEKKALAAQQEATQQLAHVTKELDTVTTALQLVRKEFSTERLHLTAERVQLTAMRQELTQQVNRLSQV